MSDWVLLHGTRTELDASFLASPLEAEGIETDIRNATMAPLFGEMPLPESEVEIWVPRERITEAKAVQAAR